MKPLTKKELKNYFRVYQDAFPDWQADVPYSLMRTCGPITQVIGFQSLSYGAYRPMCGVEVLGPPGGGSSILPQMLDVKHRIVGRREHTDMWPKVLKAIEEQFVPDVRKPLDIVEVLRYAEEQVADTGANGRYFIGLAVLNVYVGCDDRVIEWCDRAEINFNEFTRALPAPDWMLKQMEFNSCLREAIRSSRGKPYLAAASDQ